MERFHIIDDGAVILRSKGVFRQAKVYRRGEGVYAALGAGFIRLTGASGTTNPHVSWLDVEAEGVVVRPGLAPKYVAPIEQAAAA